jgi:hypothetical protein
MFDDLDNSLQQLLKRELPASVVSQVTITFSAPDSQFPPTSVSLPAIDLFLYDIRENRELRNNEWLLERRSDGTATKTRAPVRIDCSYLITAWASQGSNTPTQDEHHLLGEVVKVLLRFQTLPSAILLGSLQGQEPPLPTTSLQPGRLQSISDFWQTLGGRPRAALTYMVTIGVPPDVPVDAGAPVLDAMINFENGMEGNGS